VASNETAARLTVSYPYNNASYRSDRFTKQPGHAVRENALVLELDRNPNVDQRFRRLIHHYDPNFNNVERAEKSTGSTS